MKVFFRHISKVLQILVLGLVLVSFGVQNLKLSDDLFELVEIYELDGETEGKEFTELDDLINAEIYFSPEHEIMLVSFIESGFGHAENSWISPHLEVPELPPLNS